MSLPAPIQADITGAIQKASHMLFCGRAREYTPVIEKRIIAIATEWIQAARIASRTPTTFSFKIEKPILLSDETSHLIKEIMLKVFSLKCITKSLAIMPLDMPRENYLHPEIFAQQSLYTFQLSFSWTPENRFVYSKESVEQLLSGFQTQTFRYSKETHYDVQYDRALKGIGTDVTFKFPDGKCLYAHHSTLEAYSTGLTRTEDRHQINMDVTSYETMQRILRFIYTGDFPEEIANDFLTLNVMKEAADKYKIHPLIEWCHDKIVKAVDKFADPEKDLALAFGYAVQYKLKAMLEKCFGIAEKSDERMTEIMSQVTAENYDFVSQMIPDNNLKVMKALMARSRFLIHTK